MIVDSSAVLAILTGHPESERLLRTAVQGPCRMSAVTSVVVGIVADGRSAHHGERLDALLRTLEVEIEPVTTRQAEIARLAYRRFGRGSGSQAALDFSACFSYALSVAAAEPLLFVGDDFAHTDVAAQPY